MGKKFSKYTGTDFYGLSSEPLSRDLNKIGLQGEVRHGVRQGQPYSYIVFRDDKSIKWKIIPTVSHRGRIGSLRLYHRNKFGRRGFHSQGNLAWGTRGGLRELLEYIIKHDEWDRGGRHLTEQGLPFLAPPGPAGLAEEEEAVGFAVS